MAKQLPSLTHSPSPDCVGSSLPDGALKKGKPSRVILSERMRVEALRSAGGAKPRNEVTKGSSKDYSLPIPLLLFATKERDPSTTLRMTQRGDFLPCSRDPSTPLRFAQDDTQESLPSGGRWHEPASDGRRARKALYPLCKPSPQPTTYCLLPTDH